MAQYELLRCLHLRFYYFAEQTRACSKLRQPKLSSAGSPKLALPNAPEGKGEGDAPLEGDPGKIFVGNLPYHVKREAVKEYFSQCGPVSDIIFIRSHSDPEKNKGYCFLFFGGPNPPAAAVRAADLDGAEFLGKLLRVIIDDGRWERDRRRQRERWVESGPEREPQSEWHEEREKASNDFRKLVEDQPKDVRKVVAAFKRI
ncbi:hypothetical protein KC19_VG191800 [Ceratodon purpureus]|uniref:RRM domain-containing protein n=1 Tax=Ceratodon purpureus TaxID=3225 RepID=A0A8T0HRN8_CERPU|nr:hypothetical protein KC19_VG191800 [Ceratodon purpureus]